MNIKNYEFLYPSVAVWEDFNDLNLIEPKNKSRKSFFKGKKASYFSGGGNSAERKEAKKMKRFDVSKIVKLDIIYFSC